MASKIALFFTFIPVEKYYQVEFSYNFLSRFGTTALAEKLKLAAIFILS
ncbi:MAG TPA: hypothetical protein VLN46_01855 [Gillisia sp.]|nr:hypothetical protein [Gillisia sp.]